MSFIQHYCDFLLHTLSRFTDYFQYVGYWCFAIAIFFLAFKIIYMCFGGASYGRDS